MSKPLEELLAWLDTDEGKADLDRIILERIKEEQARELEAIRYYDEGEFAYDFHWLRNKLLVEPSGFLTENCLGDYEILPKLIDAICAKKLAAFYHDDEAMFPTDILIRDGIRFEIIYGQGSIIRACLI